MNQLPIPALDGGRLVFILLEAIRRKPVPKEKEAMVHMVGMAVLMLLMVLVMFNDFHNIFTRFTSK
jgi:regulator of sigma E protease